MTNKKIKLGSFVMIKKDITPRMGAKWYTKGSVGRVIYVYSNSVEVRLSESVGSSAGRGYGTIKNIVVNKKDIRVLTEKERKRLRLTDRLGVKYLQRSKVNN